MAIQWPRLSKICQLETMKSIELRQSVTISIFVASLCLLTTPAARGELSPRRGGTLRVEFHSQTVSLDTREWKTGTTASATNEKLAALVFDRLLALDNYGRFQPQLAMEWSHDAPFKKWQFTLRTNVKFSDGTLLNAADVAAALQSLLLNGQQITASGNSVVIQSAVAMPDLLEELASGRFFVYRVQPNGTLIGTGPFFVADASGSGHGSASSTTVTGDSKLAA